MTRLIIDHNHGHLTLRDFVIETRIQERIDWNNGRRPYSQEVKYAVGIVESGGSTSRLFHATSYKPFPVGEKMEWPLYGRNPYQMENGDWRVSCVSCG